MPGLLRLAGLRRSMRGRSRRGEWACGVQTPRIAAYRVDGVDALITQVDYLKLDGCNNDAAGLRDGLPRDGSSTPEVGPRHRV